MLHGGSNSSVNIREANLFGDMEDILYVQASQAGKPPPFAGVLITGAPWVSARAGVEAFRARGAAVVGLDNRAHHHAD